MNLLSAHLHNQDWMFFIELWNPTGFQTQHSELSWAFRVSLILEPINLQVKTFKPLRNWPYLWCPKWRSLSELSFISEIFQVVHWICIDSWSKGVINTGAADMMIAIDIFLGVMNLSIDIKDI